MTQVEKRLTVDDFDAMFDEIDKTHELVDGVVYEMAPENLGHYKVVNRIKHALESVFAWERVYGSGSVYLSELSEVRPDVWVSFIESEVSGETRKVRCRLAVEVAGNSWSYDAGAKLAAYARAGVPEYWIVRPGRFLRRHVEPDPELESYRTVTTHETAAVTIEGTELPVADLV